MTKREDGTGVLKCIRADGSVIWQKQTERHAAHFSLHDLTHFAVETTLGYKNGFFGLIAQGWDMDDVTGKGSRGRLPVEAVEVEGIVGLFDAERASGERWMAEEFNQFGAIRASEGHPVRVLSPEDIRRVTVCRDDLFQRWYALPKGETLELQFEGRISRYMKGCLVTALPGTCGGLLDAQAPSAVTVINTDRPAFADASTVVPKQSVQIENGFLETSALGERSFDFPETQWRFGVGDRTELRFTVPDYYQNVLGGSGFTSGWGDSAIGVKQQLGPMGGFDFSLVVSLSLPSGSKLVSSHGYDPAVQLPWSRKLSTNWTAGGMLSVYWPTQPTLKGTSRNTTGQVTVLFDRQLTAPWDAFVEYAGNFPQLGGPVHLLHFGTAYKLTPHQQLDFHVGAGLSAAAPDHLVGFGYSILLHSVR